MKDPDDLTADAEILEEWLRHPFTQARLSGLKREVERQRKIFFQACESSTDPKVQAEYVRFIERQAIALVFESGGKK